MKDFSGFAFGPFHLDKRDRLWRDQKPIELRAKPLAVLRYLLEHSGQVVTRDELLKHVWARIYVTKTALRVCLREIRLALKDDAKAPQYIETVGRQGYRFIGQVSALDGRESRSKDALSVTAVPWSKESYFVGREEELTQLDRGLESALAGRQQLIFVTGEAGIGKSALIKAFLQRAQKTNQLWIAQGQCIEQYGVGAPYLPLLGALRRLGQETGVEQFVQVFAQHAPVWLTHLPTLLSPEWREDFVSRVDGTSRERMLRELVEGLAALSTVRPLVLVLEDLHWSDSATVEALDYLVRSQEPARLFVLGSYRQASIMIEEPPFRRLLQELLAHKLCENIQLELLSEKEIEEYIKLRLGGNLLATELSPLIAHRTDGNALFVVTLVDYLFRRGLIQQEENQKLTSEVTETIKTELPEGLRQLILKEIEGLSEEEQRVLEAASIAGLYFTAAEVAAAERKEVERIEEVCDRFVQQQRLIAASGSEEWPDGTITTGYRFVHAMYRQVVSARMGSARQVRLHRFISERLETAYGVRAADIANHLAVHFERGRDRRAVHYRRLAAEQALRQNAYQEILLHSRTGLRLLPELPDALERKRLELTFRRHLHVALSAIQSFLDEELEANLQHALQLCRELKDDEVLVSVLIGLGRLQLMRANRGAIVELEQQESRLAVRLSDAQTLMQLHTQLAAFAAARGSHAQVEEHYQQVFAHHDSQDASSFLLPFGGEPFAVALTTSGLSLSLAGRLDHGWSRLTQALVRAEELNHPLVLANGLLYATVVRLVRGDDDEAQRLTQNLDALTQKHHFSFFKILGALLQACIAVRYGAWQEGATEITSGLTRYRALGAQLLVPFFLSFLVEGYRQQRKIIKAQQVVDEALSLTATNLDVFWEAELYRLKGELSLQFTANLERVSANSKARQNESPRTNPRSSSPDRQAKAEACFLKAMEIARQQGAKLLELRAVMSLTRLWQQQGKQQEAHQTLSNIYRWFTEGLDTEDLQTAQKLLAQWSTSPQSPVSLRQSKR